MTGNKSSVALDHYRRAMLWLSRAETVDALKRARAAFTEAGNKEAAAFCESLRHQVEAAGIDELPPFPPRLLIEADEKQ